MVNNFHSKNRARQVLRWILQLERGAFLHQWCDHRQNDDNAWTYSSDQDAPYPCLCRLCLLYLPHPRRDTDALPFQVHRFAKRDDISVIRFLDVLKCVSVQNQPYHVPSLIADVLKVANQCRAFHPETARFVMRTKTSWFWQMPTSQEMLHSGERFPVFYKHRCHAQKQLTASYKSRTLFTFFIMFFDFLRVSTRSETCLSSSPMIAIALPMPE